MTSIRNQHLASEWPASDKLVAQEHVVHVVGRLTPTVLNFLHPATQAIRSTGTCQTIVILDTEYCRAQRGLFQSDIKWVWASDHDRFVGRGWHLYKSLLHQAQITPFTSVHLHGVAPALAAMGLIRSLRRTPVKVYFSPHGSRALENFWLIRLGMLAAIKLLTRHADRQPIVNLPIDVKRVQLLAGNPVQVVEGGAANVFFSKQRRESSAPRLISSGQHDTPLSATRFSQLAVILGDKDLGISFNWVGEVNNDIRRLFQAVGIRQSDGYVAAERARQLSQAWVYVALNPERGFPSGMVEAMACAVPCVAIDSETHRHILAHTVNGFIYSTQSELIQRVAELMDSPDLRRRIGRAAREYARSHFSEEAFRLRLLQAYSALNLHSAFN